MFERIDWMGLAESVGRVAVSLQSAPAGVPQRVWDELTPWLQRLAISASKKWAPRIGLEMKCDVPVYRGGAPVADCEAQALAVCDVCERNVCLNHCRIDQHGDAVCYLCLMDMMAAKQAGGHAGSVPHDANWPWGAHEPHEPKRKRRTPRGDPNEAALRAAYKVLQVSPDAPDDEIRAQRRTLLGEWHPDKHQGERAKARAEAKFKEINNAYDLVMKARQKAA